MHGTFPLEMQRFLFSLYFEAAASSFLTLISASVNYPILCMLQGIDCRPTDSRTPVALFRGAGHRVALWLSVTLNRRAQSSLLKRNLLENRFSLLALNLQRLC